MSIFKSIKEALNPSLSTTTAKSTTQTDTEFEKIRKQGIKLMLRDMREGKFWKFYLANDDGTYTKAMTYDEVKSLYTEENLLTPKIANAIVTTDTDFLNRRGLQDCYRQGLIFNKVDTRVLLPYRIPLSDPNAEERALYSLTIPDRFNISKINFDDSIKNIYYMGTEESASKQDLSFHMKMKNCHAVVHYNWEEE